MSVRVCICCTATQIFIIIKALFFLRPHTPSIPVSPHSRLPDFTDSEQQVVMGNYTPGRCSPLVIACPCLFVEVLNVKQQNKKQNKKEREQNTWWKSPAECWRLNGSSAVISRHTCSASGKRSGWACATTHDTDTKTVTITHLACNTWEIIQHVSA